jgi:hypothetical protein
VLSHFFPNDAADLAARAEEAKNSRLWAGIHFPLDNEMGAVGGAMVGRLVIAWDAATWASWDQLHESASAPVAPVVPRPASDPRQGSSLAGQSKEVR